MKLELLDDHRLVYLLFGTPEITTTTFV